MATALESLLAAKDSLAANIAVAAAALGPTVSIDGKSVDKVGWLRGAEESLEVLNRLIQQEQPYLVVSVLR